MANKPLPLHVLLTALVIVFLISCKTTKDVAKTITLEQPMKTVEIYDVVNFDFDGPLMSEIGDQNPFADVKLEVVFKCKNRVYKVPGYFAADGKADETSATEGNIWRVKFRPDVIGRWNYKVSFTKGTDIVVSNLDSALIDSLKWDGFEGRFDVQAGTYELPDLRKRGRLFMPNNLNYAQFSQDQTFFLKAGANSPENFLAYKEFDGTYALQSGNDFTKLYESHIQDWNIGDPTWQNGKGKGIIGAINYLSDKGMNSVYMITMNIEGDGKDVWMYSDPSTFDRFDCSKLDQWDIVFKHAQQKGILLHILTQETENELLLDNGNTNRMRKLYYRELVARFGYHLAVIWNLGEENGPAEFSPNGQSDQQRLDMIDYVTSIDPMQHSLAIHSHSWPEKKEEILDPLLGNAQLDAISTQIDKPETVYNEILKWRNKSIAFGKPLAMYMDEIGIYWKGALPDNLDSGHDTMRTQVLWPSLMAGGAGVEWYFGFKFPQNDLDCEDWRSRNGLWDQSKIAIDFFQNNLPFTQMEPNNKVIDSKDGYCLHKRESLYCIYLPNGGRPQKLNVPDLTGTLIETSWFNPRVGGKRLIKERSYCGGIVDLTDPPSSNDKDWVFLIEVKKTK